MPLKTEHLGTGAFLKSEGRSPRNLLAAARILKDLKYAREAAILDPKDPLPQLELAVRGETPEVYVARVAHEKAHFALRMVRLRNMPPRLVLSADTTVTIDGRILGKPGSVTEARGMLELHFGVFVVLAFLLVYLDWKVIVFGAALIAVHHVVFDRLQAAGMGDRKSVV